MHKAILKLSILAVCCVGTTTYAATSSGTFNVQATIVKTCNVSAAVVNFGSLSTVLGSETANSTVTVTCSTGTPYNLSFTAVAGGLTKTTNLVNGANAIPANFSLGTAATAAGTGSGTATISVGLTATPYPATGLYQATQTINVVY